MDSHRGGYPWQQVILAKLLAWTPSYRNQYVWMTSESVCFETLCIISLYNHRRETPHFPLIFQMVCVCQVILLKVSLKSPKTWYLLIA